MKINILRIIIMILLLGTFSIQFIFSNQNGEKSAKSSGKIAELIEQIKPQKEQNIKRIEMVIRKIAHFSIYTLVGILLMAFISTYSIKETKKIVTSLSIGSLYAILDEIHQSFVPGRSAQITDVILDTMGVMMGILLILVMLKIMLNFKKGKKLKH